MEFGKFQTRKGTSDSTVPAGTGDNRAGGGNMKRETICLTGAAVLNICLLIGTATVFAACGAKEDGSFMHCHTACRVVQLCAVLMAALNLAGIAVKNRKLRKGFFLLQILAAVLAMLVPGQIIPLCMMPQMHCRMLMRPFVLVMEALILLTAAAGVLMGNKEKSHE